MFKKTIFKYGAASVFLAVAIAGPGWAKPNVSFSALDPGPVRPLKVAATPAKRPVVEPEQIEITTDGAMALQSDRPFVELSIANPEVADISTISETLVYVLGKRPGSTTMMMLGEGGELMRIVHVRVSPDITELKARLAELLPGEEIDAFTANDGIILLGSVGSDANMRRAVELAGHYAPGQISNLLTVKQVEAPAADFDGFRGQLRSLLPGQEIAVETVNGGIILSGAVESATVVQNAVKLAESYAPGQVTSFLTVTEAPRPVPDAGLLQAKLTEILPEEAIDVHLIGGSVVLSGEVSSQDSLQQALQVARIVCDGATISNMLTVEKSRACVVRTRKGGDLVETAIPCRAQPKRVSARAATGVPLGQTVGDEALAPVASPTPADRALAGNP
ncbi:BON domain-containing protein [Tropicimonas isoalkanivorans]|uniref:BON domain-containing protein n=1 Tax=Tropicimonas isoalkanivorans TaxID=441112 RepID=A0A1I1MK97_9RHOB|nr:BON domain-containing protein [Tropicimonas isoalkanivorans]SFC85829.1 BON domain-containing protein [Tropicimonas isoalkanivorans]